MHLSSTRALVLGLVLAGAPILAVAQDREPAQTQPDNTKVNKRDRNAGAVTADQQKMNASDRETTQKIRRAIVKDKTLSTYGHNVKVISQNGMVTLKGPVHSEEEKRNIEAKAAEIAGANNVKSEISVKEDNAHSRK